MRVKLNGGRQRDSERRAGEEKRFPMMPVKSICPVCLAPACSALLADCSHPLSISFGLLLWLSARRLLLAFPSSLGRLFVAAKVRPSWSMNLNKAAARARD